jgi:phage tail sheath protein FI
VATYQSPGVYVEEVSTGPKPIAGLPTNIAAIVGMTERGPVLEATRLSSWNDYIATFGSFIEDSYTAESVYGFFENEGTAIWVTRADNATASTWNVIDGAAAQAFTITASSPGAWSKDMVVGVARDTGGGQGQLYSARLLADVTLPNSTASFPISVDSTAGAKPGMRLKIQDVTMTGAQALVLAIVSVGAGQLTVKRPGAAAQAQISAALDVHVYTEVQAADTVVHLASGSGFQDGDVVRALTALGVSLPASVAQAVSTGVGTDLTLGADKFTAAVPAVQLVARTATLSAMLGADKAPVKSTDLSWASGAPPNWDHELRRAVAPSGDEQVWDTGASQFGFTQTVPAGPLSIDVGLYASAFSETFAPARTMSDTDIANRYAFLPVGASLRLTSGANTYTLVRAATAAGFTNAGAAGQPFTGGGPFDYTRAEYVLDLARPVVLQAPAEPESGDWVNFGGGNNQQIDTVTAGGGAPANTYLITFKGTAAGATVGTVWPILAWQATRFQPLRFKLTASAALGTQQVTEEFGNLSLDPTSRRYYHADGVVNGVSALIAVGPHLAATAVDTIQALPVSVVAGATGASGALTGAGLKAGIDRLEVPTEPALIACPDVLNLDDELDRADVIGHMLDHAHKLRRFAVVDLPELKDPKLAAFRLTYLDSTYGAAYAPFVRMINPRPNPTSKTLDVPPSGFVMGVFARTDNDRGVWKAPANEQVSGIVGLSEQYTKGRQDFLNPLGINLLRAFPGRGTRIWGARNLTDDTQWRYVNVRRLFLMLENSIDAGTQWVVFEPNDANTWLRVRVSVENFLNGIWRAGGLLGATPDQAYRVRVGLGQTMTETDIELGLLIVEVAAAPVRPAEFVVFRISQKRLTE